MEWHLQLSWQKGRLSDAGGLRFESQIGGLGVSPFQASGGISTLQSRAPGLQSTTQGIPFGPQRFVRVNIKQGHLSCVSPPRFKKPFYNPLFGSLFNVSVYLYRIKGIHFRFLGELQIYFKMLNIYIEHLKTHFNERIADLFLKRWRPCGSIHVRSVHELRIWISGFDSSRLLTLRGGVPRSTGSLP